MVVAVDIGRIGPVPQLIGGERLHNGRLPDTVGSLHGLLRSGKAVGRLLRRKRRNAEEQHERKNQSLHSTIAL